MLYFVYLFPSSAQEMLWRHIKWIMKNNVSTWSKFSYQISTLYLKNNIKIIFYFLTFKKNVEPLSLALKRAGVLTPTYLGSTSIMVWRMGLILRWQRCCTSFSTPLQWLLIQNDQISVAWNYIITQFDRIRLLIVGQVFICGSRQIIVPDATANGVKYNALKAVIITHWPMLVWYSCKMWHDLFCQYDISRY